jgi:hypothetical protein
MALKLDSFDTLTIIGMERDRQLQDLGYDEDHDDNHTRAQLAMAAATYAMPEEERIWIGRLEAPVTWPMGWEFQPAPMPPSTEDRIRELVKAGALIVAEIDRLRRASHEQAS